MLGGILSFCCLVTMAGAMIVLNEGYVDVRKVWPEYVNETMTKAHEKLSEIFPNVDFKVFRVQQMEKQLEEFYFERIKLVVDDDDIVVEPPEFYGQEPDFTFAKKIIGKKWRKAKDVVESQVPSTSIVVKKNGTQIFEERKSQNYILLEADSEGLIDKIPEYVRVLPNRN